MEPGSAFDGLDKVTMTVSFASSKESSIMLVIVIFVDVEPGEMVAIPLAKV